MGETKIWQLIGYFGKTRTRTRTQNFYPKFRVFHFWVNFGQRFYIPEFCIPRITQPELPEHLGLLLGGYHPLFPKIWWDYCAIPALWLHPAVPPATQVKVVLCLVGHSLPIIPYANTRASLHMFANEASRVMPRRRWELAWHDLRI